MTDIFFDDTEMIYSYTRKQAIEDGILIDVSQVSKEAGIKYNVCLTNTLWTSYIEFSENLLPCQSIEGRLWDVLCLFRHSAKNMDGSILKFSVLFLNEDQKHEEIELKAICHPGDSGEPCITIMMPWED